ncbi:MAG: hypothetical protein M3069_15245 [Chloroflexota bacterium]|nr:hypothetical protein [Chloroflexota bacterium]
MQHRAVIGRPGAATAAAPAPGMGRALRSAAEDRAMRGPYGIVGLVVTIVVIYLVLHFLGVI